MIKVIRLFLSLILISPQFSWAQIINPGLTAGAQASEFYVGRDIGKPLISVNLISGVNKPGIYHVPIGSDLAQVIAYAGGAHEKADLSSISIRREQKNNSQIFSIDLVESLASTSQLPIISDSDVVRIPINYTMERTSNWVGLFSGIASVILSVAIINDLNDR